jgi:hypothetical protein
MVAADAAGAFTIMNTPPASVVRVAAAAASHRWRRLGDGLTRFLRGTAIESIDVNLHNFAVKNRTFHIGTENLLRGARSPVSGLTS